MSAPGQLVPVVSQARSLAAIAFAVMLAMLAPREGVSQSIDQKFWVTNGPVRTVVASAGTVYIGGFFDQVGPATGSGVPVAAGSGAPLASYPRVTGSVAAVAADGAGGWYIGGRFTAVGGIARAGLAHVASDGALSAWAPQANRVVSALSDSWCYWPPAAVHDVARGSVPATNASMRTPGVPGGAGRPPASTGTKTMLAGTG